MTVMGPNRNQGRSQDLKKTRSGVPSRGRAPVGGLEGEAPAEAKKPFKIQYAETLVMWRNVAYMRGRLGGDVMLMVVVMSCNRRTRQDLQNYYQFRKSCL